MTDKEFERFFDLFAKIMRLPGNWMDKRDTVLEKAKEYGEENNLSEFAGWFMDDGM